MAFASERVTTVQMLHWVRKGRIEMSGNSKTGATPQMGQRDDQQHHLCAFAFRRWKMVSCDRPEAQIDPVPPLPKPFVGARVQRERITNEHIDALSGIQCDQDRSMCTCTFRLLHKLF